MEVPRQLNIIRLPIKLPVTIFFVQWLKKSTGIARTSYWLHKLKSVTYCLPIPTPGVWPEGIPRQGV